jgi:hypothetical protein
MESKVEMTLTDMAEVLSNYYTPSHARLYALQRLGIDVPKIHHKLRKNKLTDADRGKLSSLLQDLQRYIKYYGVGVFQKYYVQMWQKNVIEILNGT